MSRAGTGAREGAARPGRRFAPVLATFAVVVAGCGGRSDVPRTLVDGSPALSSDLRFEGVDGPVVRTRERAIDLPTARATPRIAACLRAGWSGNPGQPVVHRVGTAGESLTFPSRSGHAVQACDGTGDSAPSRAWCGHAFGRLVIGGLRDPRLDLGGCRTSGEDPIGFVWVDPVPGTRYVLVSRAAFSEAYEVGDDLPVRVAVTERLDLARSGVVVGLSEHDSAGRLLRRGELEAVVSG